MIKKSLTFLSISCVYFLQAQDISTVRNTVEVYTLSTTNGNAKYEAMAGSVGALGGDYTALQTNPAGLGVSITNDISLTLQIESNKNNSALFGSSKTEKIETADIGSAGGIIAFHTGESSPWKFVNVGVSYSTKSLDNYVSTPGNSSINFDIYDAEGEVIDHITFDGHTYERDGYLSKMSFGLGANYNNRIYVGAGIDIHNSELYQTDRAFFSNQDHLMDLYEKQYTPFSESASGFSAKLGVIGKLTHNFRLGAALESPTWWNMERTYSFYEDPQYGDGNGIEDRKLTTPLKATLSAAFVANKNLSVNADFLLGLTKPEYKVYGAAETELNDFFKYDYANLSEVRLGAEYRISQFRIRGGYSFARNPFDATILSTFVQGGSTNNAEYDQLYMGKKNTLAIGLGYDFNSFYLDAAFQNVTSKYQNPFLQGYSQYNAGYFSPNYVLESDLSAVSDVKNVRNNLLITLGWKF